MVGDIWYMLIALMLMNIFMISMFPLGVTKKYIHLNIAERMFILRNITAIIMMIMMTTTSMMIMKHIVIITLTVTKTHIIV